MIEQLTIQKLWFSVNKHTKEIDFLSNNNSMNLSLECSTLDSIGYNFLDDIPKKKTENSILIQGFQFFFNDKPVTFEKSTDYEKYHYLFFTSEEEALFFKEELLNGMEDNYWSDEEERLALIALGYEFVVGEDFSEISINEDRRWHETLSKWYLRDFDGLGFKMHFDGQVIDF